MASSLKDSHHEIDAGDDIHEFHKGMPGLDRRVELLAQRLEHEGFDLKKWAPDPMRRVRALFIETYVHRTCKLSVPGRRGEVIRLVRLVKVKLLADIFGVEHVLVSRLKIADGDEALSRKQLPLRRLMWNTKQGLETDRVNLEDPAVTAEDSPYAEDWLAGCKKVLQERLGLSAEWQIAHLEEDVHAHSYRLEDNMMSASYPGLQTHYAIHEVILRMTDPASSDAKLIGLPNGQEFVTLDSQQQSAPEGESTAPRSVQFNLWTWERHGTSGAKNTIRRVQIPLLSGKTLHELRRRTVSSIVNPEPNMALRMAQKGRETLWDKVENMARRISDPSYTVMDFHADLSASFPELDLYLLEGDVFGGGSRDALHSLSSSGRTMGDEYQRTVGAFFAIFWLMRLHLDGKEGFTFGVDENHVPYSTDAGEDRLYPAEKRMKFYNDNRWDKMQQLLIDADLLRQTLEGELEPNQKRIVTLLALTAVHDIMKVKALLPAVQESHAPYHGYKATDVIQDHDHALSYLMDHYPDLLPSFNGLDAQEKRSVQFTQCQLCFNQGWLVQAEAPPGAVFTCFRKVMKEEQHQNNKELTEKDVALYFVHWLTDLAGAEPTPLAGCEKFVVKFPLAVLNSFLRSFQFVQHIATKTETEVMEEYLKMRWQEHDPRPCTGKDAITKMRLLCMAQMNAERILEGFSSLSDPDKEFLCSEMSRTGCVDQSFSNDLVPPDVTAAAQGPAILVYYGPAFLQGLGSDDPVQRLQILTEVYRGSRTLWPLCNEEVAVTVIVRIDSIKGLSIKEMRKACSSGGAWVIAKKNSTEAFVELASKESIAQEEVLDTGNGTSRVRLNFTMQ